MNQEQIDAMAHVMVEARQANEDVGELIANALHKAAFLLDDEDSENGIEKLVAGRPGSWEADIVRKMATAGVKTAKRRVSRLAHLFAEIGEEQADGGDIISQAMGQAVDALGGLDQFAGESEWYEDLRNIGVQYSEHLDEY